MQDKKWLWILLLAVLSIGANFWGFPIYILDEAKNAACAMEMLQRGDWVTPMFNGQLRTDKPPLHYFFMMASYWVFGISPFSARLFSVIMGLLTVGVVYFFAKRLENERVAWFSALTLVCSLYVTMQFHLAVPDPYFIFFLTLGWLSFVYAIQRSNGWYYYVSYASVALAFMAKGPAAIVLTLFVFTSYLLVRREFTWSALKRMRIGVGALIFLLISAPWWIAVAYKTDGAWVGAFVWGHNVGRFLAPFEGHGSFPGASILLFIIALLPLSVSLPMAMYYGWKERAERPIIILSIVSVAAVLVFFSISRTLLPSYVGPAVPFGALLIGYTLDRLLRREAKASEWLKVTAVVAVVIFLVLPVALWLAISNDQWIGDMPELAWLFLPISIGALAALVLIQRERLSHAMTAYLLSFWLTGILFFYAGVPKIMARNPVASSLALIQESGREVVAYYFFNSAYVFALQRPLPTFYTPGDIQQYSTGKRVIVLTRRDYEAELTSAGFRVVFEKPYLFEGSVALVMVND